MKSYKTAMMLDSNDNGSELRQAAYNEVGKIEQVMITLRRSRVQ